MIQIVKVVALRALEDHRLWVRFSDGTEGVRPFADILAEGGPMVEPLRDPTFFNRAFVEMGVPAWPNGFDIDAIALHEEMAAAGLLTPAAAE
ncbi:DUF2442 domain-containing protein [Blastochloris viridis]|uniref:DUF2442 domain-containing protein n=1 Tax=Blastochloris viridis TaxID=1079 RepID=A0A0P0JJF8_BLAVI|nr:DUF2442 domain-containing protein [Blastochloris viridis]ALK08679.1 hypothetical protein BVIR_887 [Blastochloris viridis]CUU41342.1 hypothetical protein BVIRIDIS_03320 [Blastochloris viridis]